MAPPKKSGRTLLKEEGALNNPTISVPAPGGVLKKCPPGLERTDNNLRSHAWSVIPMINQKNYYTSAASPHPPRGPI